METTNEIEKILHRRSMITNECNSHIFTSALMCAVAIPAVIDIPVSGILALFEDDEEDDFSLKNISTKGIIYTALQLSSVVGFTVALCFAIMNNLFVNIVPDKFVSKYVQMNTFVMKVPIVCIKLSFFFWIASMGILIQCAFGSTLGVSFNIVSSLAVIFLAGSFTIVVKNLSEITEPSNLLREEETKKSVELQ